MHMNSRQGAAQSRLLMVLALVTLTLVGYLVLSRLTATLQERRRNHSEALRVAEFVLQQEFQRMHAPQTWRNEDLSGTNPATYSLHKHVLDSARIEILSRAEIQGVSREIRCVVHRSNTADSSLAIISWEEE